MPFQKGGKGAEGGNTESKQDKNLEKHAINSYLHV